MKVKQSDIQPRLSRDPAPSAMLFYGQDQGLITREVQAVRRHLLGEAEGDGFDVEIFFAGELDEERFFTSCRAFPFFSSRRFVLLKEVDNLGAAQKRSLVEYLKKPSDSSVLVLCAGNLAVSDPIRKTCEHEPSLWASAFYSLEEGGLRAWLRQRLVQQGFQVDGAALQLLASKLSGDTLSAEVELEKLILFMGEKRQVALDDILAMVGETRVHSGFGLMDAVFAGQRRQALAILDRLLATGEDPLMVLGLLGSRLRRFIQARDMLARGDDANLVAKKLNVFWKETSAFFSQCRTMKNQHLAEGLLDCLEADMALKSGGDHGRILSGLIMRLSVRADPRK